MATGQAKVLEPWHPPPNWPVSIDSSVPSARKIRSTLPEGLPPPRPSGTAIRPPNGATPASPRPLFLAHSLIRIRLDNYPKPLHRFS